MYELFHKVIYNLYKKKKEFALWVMRTKKCNVFVSFFSCLFFSNFVLYSYYYSYSGFDEEIIKFDRKEKIEIVWFRIILTQFKFYLTRKRFQMCQADFFKTLLNRKVQPSDSKREKIRCLNSLLSDEFTLKVNPGKLNF